MSQKQCVSCGKPVQDWPMCFQGDDTCSVICEKKQASAQEVPPVQTPEVTRGADE